MDAPRHVRRAAGALESAVLAVLRAVDRPMKPSEIQSAVGRDLAYNTVHTILTRLQQKGDVARVPYAGRIGYAPVKSAAQVAAERMREALQSSDAHDEILQRFITTLSPDEEDALRAALDGDRRS